MNPDNKTSIVTFVIIAAIVAWRLYARVQRFIRRQKFSKARSWFSAVFFPVLVLLLFFSTYVQPKAGLAELAELGGVIAGVALGIVGLRKTKYETTPEGLFYTPNAHIGIALSFLFIARIGYRYYQTFVEGVGPEASANNFVTSPITLLVFGTLAGYYATYAFGLIRWSRSASVDTVSVSSPSA